MGGKCNYPEKKRKEKERTGKEKRKMLQTV